MATTILTAQNLTTGDKFLNGWSLMTVLAPYEAGSVKVLNEATGSVSFPTIHPDRPLPVIR